MAKHAANSRKRNACIAAGSLGDGVAGCNFSLGISLLKNAYRHAVFDTAGQVQILGLGKEDAVDAVIAEMNGDEGSVANEPAQSLKF